jgi:DNA-binding NtrC family response regulator
LYKAEGITTSREREGSLSMSLTILYVDDDAELLTIFELMFGDDFNIRTFDNPTDALSMLSDCPTDIIISDQMMPQMNGTEFLRIAARLCPDGFRIMLTGNAAVGDVLGDIASGVINIFIPKPWTEPQMRGFLMMAANTLARRSNAKRIA